MIELRYVPIDRRNYPPPRRRAERFPLERLTILALLDDETLYAPSEVAAVGYVKGSPAYLRARRAFSYFANEHGLQETYDNIDKQKGDAKAWKGTSWKRAGGSRMHRVADLMEQLKQRLRECPDRRYYLKEEVLLCETELSGLEEFKPLARPAPTPNLNAREGHQAPVALPQPRRRLRRRLLLAILLALAGLGLLAWYI